MICKKLLLVATVFYSSHLMALQIEFDYRFDTRGFFTDQLTGAPIVERRQLLDVAATFYSGFTDMLNPITSGVGDSWSVSIVHPSLEGGLANPVTLVDEFIPQDTIKIFVGGSPSAPGVLGFAGRGFDLMATGSSQFIQTVANRGQTGDDFGVWGGYIWFNSNNSWYFNEDASGLSPGNPDFLTTAIHEIGHVLGFGSADSWFNKIVDGMFTGINSVASYGGNVPLDQFGAHWAEGVTSLYNGEFQETLMDPSTPAGERQLLTELDYAAFADIGWEVAVVPLPAAFWLMLSSFFALFHYRKNKIT